MWNYVFLIATAFLALLSLAKDWKAHESHWRRGSVIALIVALGISGAIKIHYTSRRAAEQHAHDESEITGLKIAVQTANSNQEGNTKQFLGAFEKLSKEVGDLQTQVTTEKLQSKLAGVQAELEKTQKALAPGPKAELNFTFDPFVNPPPGQPVGLVTAKSLPLNPDGNVHVEYDVVNNTDVDAVDAEINLQICGECKFAKEPEGFSKLPGLPDTERYLYLPHLLARTKFMTFSVDVMPPASAEGFFVGIIYRCHTCAVPPHASSGIVHVLR